jgi:hypothetical protein
MVAEGPFALTVEIGQSCDGLGRLADGNRARGLPREREMRVATRGLSANAAPRTPHHESRSTKPAPQN